MSSPPFQHEEGEAYMLPSTFSPWSNFESTGSADAHSRRNIALAIPARHGDESALSPMSAHSIEYSDTSSFYGERPASSDSSSSQPLDVTPLSLRREPATLREHATPQISLHSSQSIRSMYSLETIDSDRSSLTERRFSQHSTLGGSDSISPPGYTLPPTSNIDAKRSVPIMSTQPENPEAQSIPISAMYNPNNSPRSITSEDENDSNNVFPRTARAHLGCHSRRDVYIKRWSWLYVTLIILSIYSTVLSGLWLGVAIFQPQYGRSISTGSGWQITPSTATLLSTLAARTIELSFVTVFVSVLGQVLTRRAISRFSRGVTLAEMTMRNWVIQPGSLLTHWEGLPSAATTLLGALTLIATICSLFYTTASDAMVSPKLSHQEWVTRKLQGLVKTSYGNPEYIKENCPTPLTGMDTLHSGESCLGVLFSGQSYHSLEIFLEDWDDIHRGMNLSVPQQSDRPTGKHNLFDSTTMDSSWVGIEENDISALSKTHKRVVNKVTLAMPHPGVYAAATDPINGILQPSELLGIGEYSIRASVVSPVVDVMCANLNADELAPLVYTTWPNAAKHSTGLGDQEIGNSTWLDDIPIQGDNEWRNRTVVDDLFKWGPKYGRAPPVFQLYPYEYNIVTWAPPTEWIDTFFVLAKAPNITDYTLCSMQSWVIPNCSTAFDLSGTSGGHIKAHCADDDPNAYIKADPIAKTPPPSGDWRNVAVAWGLAIDLNGGVENNNASNARILTSFILGHARLNPTLPSIAEALAVLVSNTLVTSSLDATFKPSWGNNKTNILNPGNLEHFRAQVRTQQYASAYTAKWQVIFYPVLGLTFVLNVLCLLYLIAGTALTSISIGRFSSSSLSPLPPPATSPSPSPSFHKLKHNPSPFPSPIFSLGSNTHTLVKDSAPESDSEDDDPKVVAQTQTRAREGTTNPSRRRCRSQSYSGKAAKGLVTDYTEPQNLFALAVNSPPSRAFAGSCGHGPDGAEMAVRWRVGYAAGANHYFFEEARRADNLNHNHNHGRNTNGNGNSGANLLGDDDGQYGQSYKRLSSRRAWL